MLYLAENLKALRKAKDITQEDAAEILGMSPQSVSKWERGDAYPDITLLPALANLYGTTVDALIGMDKINGTAARKAVFEKGHQFLADGEIKSAAEVFANALKLYPNDESIMSQLALTLALDGGADELKRAVNLCDRVLAGFPTEKVRHTTRAALCFIYYKYGEKERAAETAQNLPHVRESRETILDYFKQEPDEKSVDAYLKFIALGKDDDQDFILMTFGHAMIPVCEELGLLEKIKEIRNASGGKKKLPLVHLIDDVKYAPGRITVKYFADNLMDKCFESPQEAYDEIVRVVEGIAR